MRRWIRESEEMYLETILRLGQSKSAVRSVDVADELGYAKSSVSRGINLLKDKGYICVNAATGAISFTQEGRRRAEAVYERHRILTAALIKLGAGRALAEENACRIEHVVSGELMEILKKFVEE